MMFFILLLVVAVAAFNIVSTLVMAVKDKRPDIAILRTIGAAPRSVARGVRDAGHGDRARSARSAASLLGVLLAVNLETLVHGLERVLGTRFMDASVYFMSDLPAHVEAARRRDDRRDGVCALLPVDDLSRPGARPGPIPRGPCAMTDAEC